MAFHGDDGRERKLTLERVEGPRAPVSPLYLSLAGVRWGIGGESLCACVCAFEGPPEGEGVALGGAAMGGMMRERPSPSRPLSPLDPHFHLHPAGFSRSPHSPREIQKTHAMPRLPLLLALAGAAVVSGRVLLEGEKRIESGTRRFAGLVGPLDSHARDRTCARTSHHPGTVEEPGNDDFGEKKGRCKAETAPPGRYEASPRVASLARARARRGRPPALPHPCSPSSWTWCRLADGWLRRATLPRGCLRVVSWTEAAFLSPPLSLTSLNTLHPLRLPSSPLPPFSADPCSITSTTPLLQRLSACSHAASRAQHHALDSLLDPSPPNPGTDVNEPEVARDSGTLATSSAASLQLPRRALLGDEEDDDDDDEIEYEECEEGEQGCEEVEIED